MAESPPAAFDIRVVDGTTLLFDPITPTKWVELVTTTAFADNRAELFRVLDFAMKHSPFHKFTASTLFWGDVSYKAVTATGDLLNPDAPERANVSVYNVDEAVPELLPTSKTYAKASFGYRLSSLQTYTELSDVPLSARLITACGVAQMFNRAQCIKFIKMACAITNILLQTNSQSTDSEMNLGVDALMLVFMCNDMFYKRFVQLVVTGISRGATAEPVNRNERLNMHAFFARVLPRFPFVPADPFALLGDRPPEFFDIPLVDVWAVYYAAHYFFDE